VFYTKPNNSRLLSYYFFDGALGIESLLFSCDGVLCVMLKVSIDELVAFFVSLVVCPLAYFYFVDVSLLEKAHVLIAKVTFVDT
jgi:hypothetical protein